MNTDHVILLIDEAIYAVDKCVASTPVFRHVLNLLREAKGNLGAIHARVAGLEQERALLLEIVKAAKRLDDNLRDAGRNYLAEGVDCERLHDALTKHIEGTP